MISPDMKLMIAYLGDTWKQRLPDPRLPSGPQRMPALYPRSKIAHHVHFPGVRGPDGKVGASHAVRRQEMGSQLLIEPVMGALIEEVEVLVTQKRDIRTYGCFRDAVALLDLHRSPLQDIKMGAR